MGGRDRRQKIMKLSPSQNKMLDCKFLYPKNFWKGNPLQNYFDEASTNTNKILNILHISFIHSVVVKEKLTQQNVKIISDDMVYWSSDDGYS